MIVVTVQVFLFIESFLISFRISQIFFVLWNGDVNSVLCGTTEIVLPLASTKRDEEKKSLLSRPIVKKENGAN